MECNETFKEENEARSHFARHGWELLRSNIEDPSHLCGEGAIYFTLDLYGTK